MLNGEAVCTTRVIRNPACLSRSRYSAAARSRPSACSSISRSTHLPAKSRWCSGRTISTSSSRRIGAGRYANVTEDRHGLPIGPIVDDVFEDIGVAAGRNAVKERPTLDADPVFDSPLPQQRGRLGDDFRLVEEHALRVRCCRQDLGQQPPLPSADIDDRAVETEVVAG